MLGLIILLTMLYIFIGCMFALPYADGLYPEETAAIIFCWVFILPVALIIAFAFGMLTVIKGICMLIGRVVGG